ncbi:MAG TPA: hypothetical protein PLC98_23455 [Anaerolineales bacterium]|nr:hypothetical protein [Anaerolineales bacterium]
MLDVPMPLSQADYSLMGFSSSQAFDSAFNQLAPSRQHYLSNVTHRMAEVEWLTDTLDNEVIANRAPLAQEGILSLQVYLLLTCADALGHTLVVSRGGVGARFQAFFDLANPAIRTKLCGSIAVWKSSLTEQRQKGNFANGKPVYPRQAQIVTEFSSRSPGDQWIWLRSFLFARRNMFTHESQHLRLGLHPNLSVMQGQRFGLPHVANLGELDRLQVIFENQAIYFASYLCDDVVAALREFIASTIGEYFKVP